MRKSSGDGRLFQHSLFAARRREERNWRALDDRLRGVIEEFVERFGGNKH
jgi:hypothetical protein